MYKVASANNLLINGSKQLDLHTVGMPSPQNRDQSKSSWRIATPNWSDCALWGIAYEGSDCFDR